jgi:hypothetical protein
MHGKTTIKKIIKTDLEINKCAHTEQMTAV